nr:hypothetical protein [uncultured Bacteroides sp.]
MKKYLFILLFCYVNVVCVFSQLSKNAHIESGMFVCKANQYLIYMQNEQIDSEESIYTIKALNFNNNEKLILDRQIKNKCISMSDTSILYIKDSDLILWNLELKRKIVYYKANKNTNIIGISYNNRTSSLLLAQLNFKTKELFIKILNNRKQITFCQKIEVNEMEMEGVVPVLETLNDYFVFLVQDRLYTIDSRKLELNFISSKCDGYALKKDEIIYYKFITDEKTEGYSINLTTKTNKKIDNSLNEKIYNCEKSFLFTANINDAPIPTYIIGNKSYLWVNNKWQIGSENLVYKDNNLIVKIPFEKNIIKDNCFQWELR